MVGFLFRYGLEMPLGLAPKIKSCSILALPLDGRELDKELAQLTMPMLYFLFENPVNTTKFFMV